MIKSENGRTWSERTPEEALELLKEDIAALSPDEREALMIMLKELDDPALRSVQESRETGRPVRIYDAMIDAEYRRPMVDIETFVKDPYFLGETCGNTYPKYIDDLKEMTTGRYREVLITGSIGIGKSYVASILMCWVLYELSCLRDIHRTIGLAPGSPISIAGLSVNEELAIRVVYENVVTKIVQSPYFKNEFTFKDTKKELRFPNNIEVVALSTTDTSALGRNIISLFMDEGNFYEPVQRGKASQQKYGDRDKARFLYDQMTRRIKSRFLRNGKMPGISVIASSKRTKDDFVSKRISEASKDPSVYIMDYDLWTVDPGRFGPERFHVLVGNDTLPSRILEPEEVEPLKKHIENTGDDTLVIRAVPMEFRQDFVHDLEKSIQDIAGVATVSISPFIQQRDKLEQCVDNTRKHPFQVDEWDQTKPGTWAWNRIAHESNVRDGAEIRKMWRPIYYPERPRHVHIDLSLNTDCTGICCGCVIGNIQIDRKNLDTGEVDVENSPVIWVDFMLRIKPPIGGEIDHGQVRGLVYQLQSHGFHIGLVTMDQVGASSIQIFNSQGIRSERLSVDRPLDPYDTLKTAIYENRVKMYRYEPILNELRKLQIDRFKGKVDHQRGEKKDLADALCGVVYTLSQKTNHAPIMIMKGISQYGDPELEADRQSLDSAMGGGFFPPILIG